MNGRSFHERDLHLALDGELPAEERAAFEAWLKANPEFDARYRRYEADAASLREGLAGPMQEPVPARLLHAASGERHLAVPPRRLSWQAAAAVVLLALGLSGGYVMGRSGVGEEKPAMMQMADRAIMAHNIYAAEKLHVVEVAADQKAHLDGWLSKRIGLPLAAPDLRGDGFELLGGRLLPAGAGMAAQFMYQDRSGNRLSLYVTPERKKSETGFRLTEEDGTRAYYWLDDFYGCVVAGKLPEAQLLAIAKNVYEQLMEGTRT